MKIRDFWKAYQSSNYRDVEFDMMMNTVSRELGTSVEEVLDILQEVLDKNILKDITPSSMKTSSFALSLPANPEFRLFKKAANASIFSSDKYSDVLLFFSKLESAVTARNGDSIAAELRTLEAALKKSREDEDLRRAFYAVINDKMNAGRLETIDDIPVLKNIKTLNPGMYQEIGNITAENLGDLARAGNYIPRIGATDEVAYLAKELNKATPDPRAVERFKEIARSSVGWGRNGDAARQLSDISEYKIRDLLPRLNISSAEQQALLRNIKNNAEKSAKFMAKQEGFVSNIQKAISVGRGVGPLERLKAVVNAGLAALKGGAAAAKGGIAATKVLYLIPRLLWKIPVIGPFIGLGAGALQTATMYGMIKNLFDDDDADSSPSAGTYTTGSMSESAAGPAAGYSDLDMSGKNLRERMQIIMKKTFGPRLNRDQY